MALEELDQADPDFHSALIDLLEHELRQSPKRQDLRYKLLELYVGAGRVDDFHRLLSVHEAEIGPNDPQHEGLAALKSVATPRRRVSDQAPAASSDGPATPRQRRFHEAVDPVQLEAEQQDLKQAFQALGRDRQYWQDLVTLSHEMGGAPPPVTPLKPLGDLLGVQVWLRDERTRQASGRAAACFCGQALVARAMGRNHLIAGGGDAGDGLLLARAAVQLGMRLTLLMSAGDHNTRAREVDEAVALGANISTIPERHASTAGAQRETLARAMADRRHSFYVSPSWAGPEPWAGIVRELYSLHGRDLKRQLSAALGRAPDAIIVGRGGGMAAIGFLSPFLHLPYVALHLTGTDRVANGRPSYAREFAWLQASGRVQDSTIDEAVARFVARTCLPRRHEALSVEGGAALAQALEIAPRHAPEQAIVVIDIGE